MLGYIFNFGWLDDIVRMLVENIFKISMDTHLGGSVHFFIFDSIKILILLSIMIFGISYIRSYFSVEKNQAGFRKNRRSQGTYCC